MAEVPDSSLVSVDVLALRYLADDEVPLLGVVARSQPPFRGRLALPGVLLGRGERLREAGSRALTGKLGTPAAAIRGMGQLLTFDEPLRDPRGPTLSVALWAVVAAAAPEVEFAPLDRVPELAFDHDGIVRDCRPALGDLLWRETTFTRALLGERFTLARAVTATAALQGGRPDPANLNRLLRRSEWLERDESERVSTGGRPAAWWTWRSG
ncbi:NUDIX hydrolase [Nakamurella sp. YIM 132087]|uniref:NUDIX hydrolase n=1 Tax=Nakamurella alba TaxID=2665158 RepID=A0A7K1FMJ9_9ACTN|nr:NUDIX hydrolase [Nakamurella alba]MTD15395.1 NUDIX hydrolase [Nakamurella alba]